MQKLIRRVTGEVELWDDNSLCCVIPKKFAKSVWVRGDEVLLSLDINTWMLDVREEGMKEVFVKP